MENGFKEFQNSRRFMTNDEFNGRFGFEEFANGEVGVFTYGKNTCLHIEINKENFRLTIGNQVWESKGLTELEQIFWNEWVKAEYGSKYFAEKV